MPSGRQSDKITIENTADSSLSDVGFSRRTHLDESVASLPIAPSLLLTDKSHLGLYDSTFNDTSQGTVSETRFITEDECDDFEYIIGEVVRKKGRGGKKGKVVRYRFHDDVLWGILMDIIKHKIDSAGRSKCLINMRTMSKQIEREGNIKSIVAIERRVLYLIQSKFGVPDQMGGDPLYGNGLKQLRGTMSFWNEVGGRTENNRKKLAKIYQIDDAPRIVRYISGALRDAERKRREDAEQRGINITSQ